MKIRCVIMTTSQQFLLGLAVSLCVLTHEGWGKDTDAVTGQAAWDIVEQLSKRNKALSSYRCEATEVVYGEEGEVMRVQTSKMWRKGDNVRMERTSPEGNSIVIFHPGFMYVYNNQDDTYTQLNAEPIKEWNVAVETKMENLDLRVLGHEIIDGKPVTVVEVFAPSTGERVRKLWIGDETGLEVRREVYRNAPTTSPPTVSDTMEIKNLILGDVPDRIFEIPQDKVVPFTMSPGQVEKSVEARKASLENKDILINGSSGCDIPGGQLVTLMGQTRFGKPLGDVVYLVIFPADDSVIARTTGGHIDGDARRFFCELSPASGSASVSGVLRFLEFDGSTQSVTIAGRTFKLVDGDFFMIAFDQSWNASVYQIHDDFSVAPIPEPTMRELKRRFPLRVREDRGSSGH